MMTKTKHNKVKDDDKKQLRFQAHIPQLKSPELAKTVTRPPTGNDWLHEIKYDGYRLLAYIDRGQVRLMTRKHQNWTHKFKELVNSLKKLKLENAILDGEIVVLDKKQHSNFQLLQAALSEKKSHQIIYYVFDLLYFNNQNLMQHALLERKQLLKKYLKPSFNNVAYSDHIIGHGPLVYEKTCVLGLEGIISKRINSKYTQKRTSDWVKSKCAKRQEFVVIGFTNPKGARQYFGALLLGYYDRNGILQYCGHVGTGFTHNSLREIKEVLNKYEIDDSPLQKIPRALKNNHWLKPIIVVEIEFKEWTNDGLIRQPSFKGLRLDKSPQSVTKETTFANSPKDSCSKTYAISHPQRILYPEQNITKQILAEYYDKIADLILPYINERPLVLVRCPQGYDNECFFQKHLNSSIPHIHRVAIREKSHVRHYPYIKDSAGLIALVQLNVLEIHIWGCHIDKIDQPDMITFDLDPAPDVSWHHVIDTAFLLRDELQKLKLKSFVKTTGGKGLHIVVPIKRLYDWTQTYAFAKSFTDYIVKKYPEKYVATSSKVKRNGKVFIDYFRNHRGATIIAPYSTRAREGGVISMPLNWRELSAKIHANTFTLLDAFSNFKSFAKNPWPKYLSIKQSLKI